MLNHGIILSLTSAYQQTRSWRFSIAVFKEYVKNINLFVEKGQNSPSLFTMMMAPTSSTRLTLATSFARWTWTPQTQPSRNWAARRRRARKNWNSTNSCPSLASAKKTRNKVATRTSLNVWSCTTNRKTEWCWAQNCLTHFCHLVCEISTFSKTII